MQLVDQLHLASYDYYPVLYIIAKVESTVGHWKRVRSQLRLEPLLDDNGQIPDSLRLLLLKSLANAEFEGNKLIECNETLSMTARLIRKLEGDKSASMALCLFLQGRVSLRLGRLADGRRKIETASALLAEDASQNNRLRSHVLLCQSEVKAAEGRLDDSKGLLEEAINLRLPVLDPENPCMLDLYFAYAKTLSQAGDSIQASSYEKKIASIKSRFESLQDVWLDFKAK